MPVQLYLDVHIDKAIHDQLRLRGVDVLRAQDDGAAELSDDELLARSSSLGRLLFTHDTRSRGLRRIGNAWASRSQACSSATSSA